MHQFPKIAQIQKKCPFFTGLHLKRARRTKSRSPKGLRLVDTIISMGFWDWIGLNSVTIVGHKSENHLFLGNLPDMKYFFWIAEEITIFMDWLQ